MAGVWTLKNSLTRPAMMKEEEKTTKVKPKTYPFGSNIAFMKHFDSKEIPNST